MLNALDLQLIAIAHATVIDPAAGSSRPDMTVLVRGTRIEAAGPSRSVLIPAGTRVIDATGLLDANPLTDIANTRRISTVVANGRLNDAPARRALFEMAQRAATP
jgi:hypothetical protein